MSLDDEVRERIESTLKSDQVVLFMKGTREQPQCGFSATVIGILEKLTPNYATVNVLEDPGIRDGIKEYSSWPTIPQLYVDQEFMGGCDIVKQMFNSGDLHNALGVEPPDRTPPEISISYDAAQAIRDAVDNQPGTFVHLSIDASWNHEFALAPAEGSEVRTQSNGIEILLDLDSAQRAKGLSLDMTESLQGRGFSIDNPNAPPPVKTITASELKDMMDSDPNLRLFDVRDQVERSKAKIEGSVLLDEAAVDLITGLSKDEPLFFHCHFGPRSQSAADHFRSKGYSNLFNVIGGIDSWSQDVDASVPRY